MKKYLLFGSFDKLFSSKTDVKNKFTVTKILSTASIIIIAYNSILSPFSPVKHLRRYTFEHRRIGA